MPFTLMTSSPIIASLAVPMHSLSQGRPKIESVIYKVVHDVHLIYVARLYGLLTCSSCLAFVAFLKKKVACLDARALVDLRFQASEERKVLTPGQFLKSFLIIWLIYNFLGEATVVAIDHRSLCQRSPGGG